MTRIRNSKRLLFAAALAALLAFAAGTAFAALAAPPGIPPKLDPPALGHYYLGNQLVRAEIVVRAADALHDYWIDQGRVARGGVTPGSLKMKEKTGDVVTIAIASNAFIRLNGRPAPLSQLKAGDAVLTIRDGQSSPAVAVRATSAR